MAESKASIALSRVEEEMQEKGLGDYYPKLKGVAQLALVSDAKPVKDETEIPLGGTKLGGRPDVWPEFTWPSSEAHTEDGGDLCMTFLCQVNLADVRKVAETSGDPSLLVLPPTGLLLFFFQEQSNDVLDYGDAYNFVHGKVLYYDGSFQDLKRTDFPSQLSSIGGVEPYPERHLDFWWEWTLPDLDSTFSPLTYDSFEDDTELEVYCEFVDRECSDVQVFGHPLSIQGSVEEEAQTSILSVEESPIAQKWKDLLAAPFGRKATDWRLLAAIGSGEKSGMMWGDAGTLYYMITEEDLKANRYDRVASILQCY